MFTIEMDFDDIEITVVDDTANYEDLKVHLFDDIVYIRQWQEHLDAFVTIAISPAQWDELVQATNKPEGAYVSR